MKGEINTKYNPDDIVYIITPERRILKGKVTEIWKTFHIYPQEDAVTYYGITPAKEDYYQYQFSSPENCVYSTEEEAIAKLDELRNQYK